MSTESFAGKCGRCGAEFAGQGTEKGMELLGFRKVNGKWICNFCANTGFGGIYRKEAPEGDQP